MPRFARSDFPKTARWGHQGLVRDVALLTFHAHPDIAAIEVLAATPRSGFFTVRIALEPPGDFDRAAYYMRDLFEEWVPANTRFVIEPLPAEDRVEALDEEQLTLG